MTEWKKFHIRHNHLCLHNTRWWQFWLPKYEDFSLDLCLWAKGDEIKVTGVQLEPTESRDD